jgi:glycosyltransferase involved in cell wall biosynthesis
VAKLLEAAELEPALSWTAGGFGTLPEWDPPQDDYSSLLISIVTQLRGHAEAIVAVPWVGIGGADLVSLNYANAFMELGQFDGKVSMLATYTPSRTLRHLIPEGVNFVQIPETFRTLSPDLQRRLLAQALILVRPTVIMSVNCFDVTNSLQLFGRQMGLISRIHLTLFAFDRIGAGYPVNPITDDGQREYLDDIVQVITDNNVTAEHVKEMLGLDAAKVGVHHQPAMALAPPLRTGTRAYNNRYFSEANPFKLLWPHRLDKEKRPDTLVAIASRLRADGIPAEIHVYGQQVLSSDGESLMKALSAAGIKYHGPYGGGLSSLPTHEYHAILLTSESEGLPLVLVQSMLLGLPVIAAAVGGVPDLVRDGETGLLVSGPDDVEGFVLAIRALLESLDARRRLIHAAYDFSAAQHGWPKFTSLVAETIT